MKTLGLGFVSTKESEFRWPMRLADLGSRGQARCVPHHVLADAVPYLRLLHTSFAKAKAQLEFDSTRSFTLFTSLLQEIDSLWEKYGADQGLNIVALLEGVRGKVRQGFS
jgi:hypothetical protein